MYVGKHIYTSLENSVQSAHVRIGSHVSINTFVFVSYTVVCMLSVICFTLCMVLVQDTYATCVFMKGVIHIGVPCFRHHNQAGLQCDFYIIPLHFRFETCLLA